MIETQESKSMIPRIYKAIEGEGRVPTTSSRKGVVFGRNKVKIPMAYYMTTINDYYSFNC